jgi:arylsulfatase A-like enzyme
MNVLLVTLDTLRTERLGIYGHSRNTSPVIDALAAGAVVFENAIAQSAVTPVSHASILTGLEPHHHGLRSMHGGVGYALPEERLTLAEIVRAHGYATGGFVSAFPTTRHFGLDQGFETWNQDFEGSDGRTSARPRGFINTGAVQRRADATTARALAWLRESGGNPFFAWVHYFDVHDGRLLPPEEYLGQFPPRSSSSKDAALAIYDAEIAFVDAQIGWLLRALKRMGVRDRTIVALVADHGEGLGDHGWWGHGILYQEQVRVPLVLSIPGLGEGRRVAATVRTIDLVPTLVELLEIEPGPGDALDGESLVPLIEGETAVSRIAYSESLNDLAAYYDSPFHDESLYGVNDGRWKLIAHYAGADYTRFELFDLAADPHEQRDVFERHPEEAKRLLAYLESRGAVVPNPPRPTLDDATRERLRALGYVR